MRPIHTKTYIFTFLATIVIFSVAIVVSSYLTHQKTNELIAEEDKISIDIVSLETQYDLLKASSCSTFNRGALREELNSLSTKLSYLEGQVGANDPEVFRLKRYYALLEIKDYILTKQMATECHLNTIFILYFYTIQNCPECQTQNYMLQAIQNTYPNVEMYSFDYMYDLSAVQTLISLRNVPSSPPILEINGTNYPPFQSLDQFNQVITSLTQNATTTASTTKSTK